MSADEFNCHNCGLLGDAQEYLREHARGPLQSWVWCETCQLETFIDCPEDGQLQPTDRPGPFSVEIWEVPGHWDAVATTWSMLEAAQLASYTVRRDWRVHGNESRVQILDGDGRVC